MPGASVCPVAWSCRGLPFSESPIGARHAADRCSRGALDGAVPDSHPDGSRIPRWSPYLGRWPPDWRERAPTQASGSCVSRPCPPESGPSASDLRGPDDRIVSSKRDVRVFHKGNFPSSRFLLIYLDVSCLDPFTNVLPRTTLNPPLLVTRVVRLAFQVLLRSPTPACASLPTSLPLIGLLTRLLAGTQTGLLGSRINLPYRAVSKHLGTMGE